MTHSCFDSSAGKNSPYTLPFREICRSSFMTRTSASKPSISGLQCQAYSIQGFNIQQSSSKSNGSSCLIDLLLQYHISNFQAVESVDNVQSPICHNWLHESGNLRQFGSFKLWCIQGWEPESLQGSSKTNNVQNEKGSNPLTGKQVDSLLTLAKDMQDLESSTNPSNLTQLRIVTCRTTEEAHLWSALRKLDFCNSKPTVNIYGLVNRASTYTFMADRNTRVACHNSYSGYDESIRHSRRQFAQLVAPGLDLIRPAVLSNVSGSMLIGRLGRCTCIQSGRVGSSSGNLSGCLLWGCPSCSLSFQHRKLMPDSGSGLSS